MQMGKYSNFKEDIYTRYLIFGEMFENFHTITLEKLSSDEDQCAEIFLE